MMQIQLKALWTNYFKLYLQKYLDLEIVHLQNFKIKILYTHLRRHYQRPLLGRQDVCTAQSLALCEFSLAGADSETDSYFLRQLLY